MSYWQDPEDHPMSAEQASALESAIKDILGVEIDEQQLEQMCDILMFGYPPSVRERLADEEAQHVVWEYVHLAETYGCTLEELFDEVHPRLCEENGYGEPDEATRMFFGSVLAYYNEHPKKFTR